MAKLFVSVFIFLSFFVASVVCSSTMPVVPLTIDNFTFEIKDTPTFVKFYVPWCGHCAKLAPTWEAVAASVHASGAGKCSMLIGQQTVQTIVKVAEVDCTVDSELCNKYNVRGYPTLLYFSKSGQQVPFQGQRTEEALIEFFTKHLLPDAKS